MANRFENKVRIIEHLRKQERSTRPAMAERLNINLPTTCHLTKQLLDERVICCDGFGDSEGGRRAELLTLNPSFATAIGLELSLSGIRGVLADLGGNVLDLEEGPLRVPEQPQEIVDAVLAVGEALLARSLPARRPIGVGLATAGLVDEYGRILRRFPHRELWDSVPLAQQLEERLGLPAFLENDVQLATLAAKRYGVARGVSNFLYLHIGQGIASGIVVNDRRYMGATRNAGEIGHTIVEPGGPICYCGNYGCLESLASPAAILEQTVAAIRKGVQSSISPRLNDDLSRVSPAQIYQASDLGDRLATNVVSRAAEYIGMALANLVNFFNPAMVVFGGSVLISGHRVLNETIERTFRSRVLPALQDRTRVCFSTLGRNAGALGGAAVVFEDLFDHPALLFSVARGFQPGPGARSRPLAEQVFAKEKEHKEFEAEILDGASPLDLARKD